MGIMVILYIQRPFCIFQKQQTLADKLPHFLRLTFKNDSSTFAQALPSTSKGQPPAERCTGYSLQIRVLKWHPWLFYNVLSACSMYFIVF